MEVLPGLLLDVKPNLLIEAALQRAASSDRPHPPPGLADPSHRVPPLLNRRLEHQLHGARRWPPHHSPFDLRKN